MVALMNTDLPFAADMFRALFQLFSVNYNVELK